MKHRQLLLSLLSCSVSLLSAQAVQWLRSEPVGWDMNYEMPGHLIEASGNGQVSIARQVGEGMAYGQDIFNTVAIERLDPATGLPTGTCTITDSVLVESIAVGDDGITYVAGRFIGGIQFCDGSALAGDPGFLMTDLFLAAFGGNNFGPLWSRNLSMAHPDGQRVPAIEVDVNGTVWYGLEEFQTLRLIAIDAQGTDMDERTISGTRTLGGFSFDPSNNLFVSGSTGLNSGPLVFGGLSVDVNESYMMFVLHINVNGTGDWAQLAHDVTFSSPDVVAGVYGEAFVSGNVMDSLSWGDVHLHGPDWVSDVFLVRVDAAGEFDWGIESAPASGPIMGDMNKSRGPGIACDANGKVYLTGTVRGQVNWGNNVVSDALTLGAQAQTVVCFANNGTPLWQKTSTPGSLSAQNIACDEEGNLFFTAHALGTYSMAPFTENNGGGQAFADGRIDASSTAVAPSGAQDALNAWPVPAREALFVRLDGERTMCRLISSTGAIVRRDALSHGTNRIDLGYLPAGTYTLLLDDGTSLRVMKE